MLVSRAAAGAGAGSASGTAVTAAAGEAIRSKFVDDGRGFGRFLLVTKSNELTFECTGARDVLCARSRNSVTASCVNSLKTTA